MSGVRNFTDLLMWQRARQWSKDIFLRAKQEPFCRDQRLVVQINDSTESVMSNIAEGFGRSMQNEFITFLGYALGSLDETRSHLCAAYDRAYLGKAEYAVLFQEGTEIRKLIVGFIRKMVMPGAGVKTVRPADDWTQRVWDVYERATGKQRPSYIPPRPAKREESRVPD
jgi:four helix bundle protein